MRYLYTDTIRYGLERQKRLQGERRPERVALSDGRLFDSRQWFHRATEWLVDHLATVGKSLPCVDNDLACDMQFVG